MDGLSLEQSHRIAEEELRLKFETQRREENQRIADAREKAAKDAENAKAEARRAEADAALTEQLKTAFFANNAAASADDFERVKARLRDDHLIRMAATDPVEQEAQALAARMPPGFAGRF